MRRFERTMRRVACFGCATAAWIVAGCGASDADATSSAAVRDSAGVTIVEHVGSPWELAAPWTVAAEPALRIGVVDGAPEYMFDRLRAAVRLGDGRIVAANAGTNTIRWYDAQGEFLFERGGSGGGPGEFDRLARITRAAGDTVVALDWTAARLTLFGPDGTLGRTVTAAVALPLGPVHRIADGSFIAGVSGFSTSQLGEKIEPGLRRYPVPMLHIAPNGERIDTIGVFPGSEVYVQAAPTGGGSLSVHPPTPLVSRVRFIFGTHQLGKEFQYAVADDRVYVGTAEGFDVNVYDADGTWVRSIRVPDMELDVTDATMDSLKSRLRSRAEARDALTPAYERSLADMAVPETRPAYRAILVDAEQNLWVNEHRIDGLPERWAVFDADGNALGALTVPETISPLYIGGGVILGRETDDLGVESLVVYEIQR
jgi:hypothetical protein